MVILKNWLLPSTFLSQVPDCMGREATGDPGGRTVCVRVWQDGQKWNYFISGTSDFELPIEPST